MELFLTDLKIWQKYEIQSHKVDNLSGNFIIKNFEM